MFNMDLPTIVCIRVLYIRILCNYYMHIAVFLCLRNLLNIYSICRTIFYVCFAPCRFTARVDELLRVLKDLQVGRYQRTMVSSKPAEEQDNGVCGLPTM